MSSEPVSPYQVLGIDQTATATQVRQAYQRALRAQRYSRKRVTHAFNQLRNAQSRLGYDLLEPASASAANGLGAILADVRSVSFIDEGSAPLPRSESLVMLGLERSSASWRDVPEAASDFRAGTRLGAPPRDVLPPVEFPI